MYQSLNNNNKDKSIVLLNSLAGEQFVTCERVRGCLAAAGIQARLQELRGDQIVDAARQALAQGPSCVIAAGGDGTVHAVAGVLAGSPVPMGILPLGTFNHFARDLGIPLELAAAARVIAARKVRQVDMAKVNERFFLNNASIGMYPSIVRRREGQRSRLGRGKVFAMALAIISAFRRYPMVRVRIEAAGRVLDAKTPVIFVGNNSYAFDLLNLGRRASLDSAALSVYFAVAPSRLKFLALALRALLGRLRQGRDFQSMNVSSLRIDTPRQRLRVALDGEVLRMHPPLQFEICPRLLSVLAP